MGVLLSEKTSSTNHSTKCIDTLIGAGMRVEGDIACTGVLRVQGDIIGNVSCHDNPGATLVVDNAGSVTGTVNASHVAVRGRVVGPVRSSQAIEIHQGGSLVGDISFKELAIHAGGIVQGSLNPAVAIDTDQHVREPQPPGSGKTLAPKIPPPVADGGGLMNRFGGARKIGAAVLLAVVVAGAWLGRNLAGITHPADVGALRADSSLKDSTDPKLPLPGDGGLRSDPKVIDADAAPLAPAMSVGAQDSAQTPPSGLTAKNQEKVVTVRGANPRRPTGVFLLIGNEPSVLYRKKRDDPGDGTRIAVAEGEKVSVSIAPDELIRVAQGTDVVILFQGQKVPRNTIESGSWISFVPR